MKRARLTAQQLIAIRQEHRAGARAEDPGRRHGFSPGWLDAWKRRYGRVVGSATGPAL